MIEKIARSLLLVEDDQVIAMTEKFSLELAGYKVIQASTGEQAVAIVNDGRAPVDLVLMDIDLGPGIDGTQAAQEILKKHDIPIVFLSAHTEREIVDKTEKITSYGYVVKNSGNTVLTASIRMAFKLHAAHRELELKERKFSTVFHVSPSAASITVERDGRYIDVNDSFLKMTGYKREELIDHTVFEIEFWADPEDGRRLRRSLKEQGTVRNYEYVFRRKDGGIGQALLSATILDIEGEPCILAEANEITEIKRLENALRESERKYRRIFESVIEGIFQSTPDGRYISISPSLARMHGYDSPAQMMEAITDIAVQYYVRPLDRERLKTILTAQGRAESFAAEVYRKNGSRMWISVNASVERDQSGEIRSYIGTVHEISGPGGETQSQAL